MKKSNSLSKIDFKSSIKRRKEEISSKAKIRKVRKKLNSTMKLVKRTKNDKRFKKKLTA